MERYPLDVCFRLLETKRTIKAIENGEDNWKEILVTTDKVRCTSPLKENVYKIIRRQGVLIPIFSAFLVANILEPNIGRVFMDGYGGLVVETALSVKEFTEVMQASVQDTMEICGLI